MENNIISTQIYKKIVKGIERKGEVKKLNLYMKKFIDRSSDVLFTPYPVERLIFSDKDRNTVYEAADITDKEIKLAIKNIKFINSSWKALNNPFNFLMLSLIKYFTMKKDEENTELCIMYISLQFYTMHHIRYLRYVQKETMVYTITNLSNKHDIKQYGTIFKALNKKAMVNHVTYLKNIKSNDDKKLIDYIVNLNNRIKQWIIGIMEEYRKNKDSGKFFNSTKDDFSDENFRETTNSSMEVQKLTDRVTNYVIKNHVNFKLSEMSAKMVHVNKASLFRTLKEVRDNVDNEEIHKFIGNILEINIIDGKNDADTISSRNFINHMLKLYNRSNTSDEKLIEVKETLDKWLNEHSVSYLKTNRVATKISWRKSVFIYYSFLIQYYYNN